MIEYVVVWDGRGALPDDRRQDGVTAGWNQKGSYLLDAAHGNIAAEGLPSTREMKGKGVLFDPRHYRSYRSINDVTHVCLCGKGVPDAQWSQGIYLCYRCQKHDEKRRRRERAAEQVAG